ncbi:MAG: GGDEF domain-containing protein, partial [Gammaproteobacteria bacterium]
GVRHFYRKPTLGYKPVAPFMVLFTLLLALELFLPVLPDWRVIWAAGVIALFSTLTLYEFLQRRLLSNPIILLMITRLFFTSGSWLLRALVSLDHTAHMTRYAFVDPLSLYDAIVASVTLTVSMIVLTNERINQQLWNQASRDPLTGVMNRRAFYEASAPLLAELHREPINLSVCVLDIDHFKKLNDNHGHAVGDLILKEFVRTARTTLREGDLFARYGGEEFVILLHNSDLQQAQHALQRLREACVNQGIMAGEQQVSVTFSAGICHATGPAQVSLDTLLEAADRAMYQAKKAGRDRIIVSPEHHGAPPPLAATSGANS